MSYPRYIDRYHRVDPYERKENAPFSAIFGGRQSTKMAIFELSSISKKLKRFRTFEWYFRKQLTLEVNLFGQNTEGGPLRGFRDKGELGK